MTAPTPKFHLSDTQVTKLHGDLHDLAAKAAQAGQTARAEALQEAAQLLHKARMQAFEQRAGTARRRRQRQLQGASH